MVVVCFLTNLYSLWTAVNYNAAEQMHGWTCSFHTCWLMFACLHSAIYCHGLPVQAQIEWLSLNDLCGKIDCSLHSYLFLKHLNCIRWLINIFHCASRSCHCGSNMAEDYQIWCGRQSLHSVFQYIDRMTKCSFGNCEDAVIIDVLAARY